MQKRSWRNVSPAAFDCEKHPVSGRDGIVAANHPLGSAAGANILAAGGNAVDAAVATLLTLTVVEPMMVGLAGGGMMHIRTSDGEHVVIDGQSQAPLAATPDMFECVSDEISSRLEAVGRKNAIGPLSTATAGNLAAWSRSLEAYGTMSLADVIGPAIHHAEHGFRVSPYLSECIDEAAEDLAADPLISALFLPDGAAIQAGERLRQPAYAETLKAIAANGAGALAWRRGRRGHCGLHEPERRAFFQLRTCATTSQSNDCLCAGFIRTSRSSGRHRLHRAVCTLSRC